ncbi:MAG: ACT domain-containing protein [Clostridium sp.]|jgi:chorismate mutase|uniref:ACT domain-containing protein n=1 Tax=Clostridium sp. TaxID=1506 RepID=UPI0025BA0152|nr:ACT domain-containing protein [Clostridium sp.]MCH3964743.1 ACT domain-containing protein [Clostridium sp.]MCI1715214.1 ACT domain-containing protein [Clostridium sp.]MCI1799476.1 ACT domain-containing protein [Clostridium sp.]MCI1813397.1 ACT domain-containing protein [Clostridium sp.]MCI1870288.1 ACT domain-containing protein [Clostridium sp.]
MNNKFLIIDSEILPDVFLKVVKVKELLRTGKVKDISQGTKEVGISRSTYYKYKDSVFAMSEGTVGHKITLGFMILHKAGTLSKIIDKIAQNHGNILTINQDIPINNAASVSITFDASKLSVDTNQLVEELESIDSVVSVRLVAVE